MGILIVPGGNRSSWNLRFGQPLKGHPMSRLNRPQQRTPRVRGSWNVIALMALVLSASRPSLAQNRDDILPPGVGERLRTEGLTEIEQTHRPRLVFAPSRNDKAFLDQMDRLHKARTDLGKSDVVVAAIFEYQGGQVGPQPIDMSDASKIRRLYNVDDGALEIILVGKDGKEKWRHHGPVAVEALLEPLGKRREGDRSARDDRP